MLKFLARRYRKFMQAEIMEELRKQNELAKQMESALLTIALTSGLRPETHRGAPPLETPPGPGPSGALSSALRADGTLGPAAPDPH